MANHPDVDLVVVSVSVPAHHGMVTAGLEAGKHVFCEWPLGANSGETEELARSRHREGRAHPYRSAGAWRPRSAAG